jgi:hypothetical protein
VIVLEKRVIESAFSKTIWVKIKEVQLETKRAGFTGVMTTREVSQPHLEKE